MGTRRIDGLLPSPFLPPISYLIALHFPLNLGKKNYKCLDSKQLKLPPILRNLKGINIFRDSYRTEVAGFTSPSVTRYATNITASNSSAAKATILNSYFFFFFFLLYVAWSLLSTQQLLKLTYKNYLTLSLQYQQTWSTEQQQSATKLMEKKRKSLSNTGKGLRL